MKYIGLIKTDDLPSTSIGLRVSEMAKLGFSPIILYAKTRTTVAKQFRRGTVISNEQRLKEEIAKQGDCVVVIAAKHAVDANGVKALGEPKKAECRCLAGQRFVGCTSEGERSVVKVFEYDRRKGVSRFDRGDSGDIKIDVPSNKGLMAMRSDDFLGMLEHGDSFISSGEDFQEAADLVGVSTICSDPISAGVSWHAGKIHDEKKPVNVVYGEKQYKGRIQIRNEVREDAKKEEPIIPKPTMFPTPVMEEDKNDAEPNNESEIERDNALPVLSVVFQTHNRTATACYCLDALCKRLRYSGKIHYCICDDRSMMGHVAALENVLRSNGASSYSIHVTTDERFGLGASMNNGLSWSFRFTGIVLTIEDDFLLNEELDITPYVLEAEKPDVAGIKLASQSTITADLLECGHPGFRKVVGKRKQNYLFRYTFNNLVMLRHKRVFDEIGMYIENASPPITELDALRRFNAAFSDGMSNRMKILWPTCIQVNTYDSKYFKHIGVSTIGNRYRDASLRYSWLADEKINRSKVEEAVSSRSVEFHIIIPCFNSSQYLDRCLESIAKQKTSCSYRVTVVDDVSDDEESLKTAEVAAKYPFCSFMPLHSKGMAGGARNHAIYHSQVKSAYTLFLDSDDEYSCPDALETIRTSLEKAGFPDLAFIGYYRNGKESIPRSQSMSWAAAPWSRCVKTSKLKPFVPGRRVCNDTMQYLMTVDSCDSFINIQKPLVRYNNDNKNSGWSNRSVLTSRAGMEGMMMTMLDILFGKYRKDGTVEDAKRSMRFIEGMFVASFTKLKKEI